ncbi:hypothetical protein L0244_10920 [bacterium]|nr:hypothetical protein [bacterium]MCI0690379.1 hypothetical protein [candidate division KSB1 bacterium]
MNKIETISTPKFSKENFYALFFETQWPAPAIKLRNFSDSTSATDRIFSQIKDKLKNQKGIEAVWIEDRGKQINVYIMTKDVRNSTLDLIFDARLALYSQYSYISFNFELNPVDLEQKQLDNYIQRLI